MGNRPETAFYSPLGKKHRVENIGNEPLRIVWAVLSAVAGASQLKKSFQKGKDCHV